MDPPKEQQHQQLSPQAQRTSADVACQTDSLELDEATLRNELAMAAYLEILGVLDDDRQPVYHDLGEAYANKVFLQAMAADDVDEEPMEEEEEEQEEEPAAAVAAAAEEAAESAGAVASASGGGAQLVRLQSLESQVIDAEWSIRSKLAQVRESAKHPVQRWLEGALPSTATASPFASRAPSVHSSHLQQRLLHQHQHQHQHQHSSAATMSHCSRPSSVAALSEVFVSDSDDDDEDDDDDNDRNVDADAATPAAGPQASKSEMTFYDCAVHGVEVPESFVRVKLRLGPGGGGGGGGGKDEEEKDQATGMASSDGLHND